MFLKTNDDQMLTEGEALDLWRVISRICRNADIYLAACINGQPAADWRYYVAHNSTMPAFAARAEHAADLWQANRMAQQRAGQQKRYTTDVVAALSRL